MLEMPVQRDQCCHTAGSIAFDAQGQPLPLHRRQHQPARHRLRADRRAAGPRAVGRAEVVGEHERPARQDPAHPSRARRHVHDPRGQPLPEGDARRRGPRSTRWGTAIPIASRWTSTPASSTGARSVPTRRWIRAARAGGPRRGRTRRASAGYFGWPYFVGDNKAYYDYDFATKTPGEQFDPAHPVNDSPNNTGLQRAAAGAEGDSSGIRRAKRAEFPLVGTGGRTAMAGPVFHRATSAPRRAPSRRTTTGSSSPTSGCAAGSWRSRWTRRATSCPWSGSCRARSSATRSSMEFSPSGDLYMLEYGTGWFQGNPRRAARAHRVQRRQPEAGRRRRRWTSRPARCRSRVALSSAGHDRSRRRRAALPVDDHRARSGVAVREADASRTRRSPSRSPASYTASLDRHRREGREVDGARAIVAGNEPPQVEIDVVGGNRSFFFPGTPIALRGARDRS